MKYISFERAGRAGFGLIFGNSIIDLTDRIDGVSTLRDFLGKGLQGRAEVIAAQAKPDCMLSEVNLLPVIPNPNKIICVGINYVKHAEEAGRKVGQYPVIFQRYADSLLAHGKPLLRPQVSAEFDYEGELAIVIGKGGGHIAPEDAMSHVAGYTCFNDASVRDWQFHTHQYGMGKNFRSTAALGPWLVSADEIPDYRQLRLRTLLNGQELQQGALHELAFDVPHLISYVSQSVDWQPGDILATGTPSGIGFKRTPPIFMKQGDVCEIVIDSIGTLSNPVMDESRGNTLNH